MTLPPTPSAPLALVCHALDEHLGGLRLQPWPLPRPGPAEVRLAVHAAALNFPDLLMTRGTYQHRPALPYVCGMEGAGVVLEAGPDSGWQPGDRVCFAGKEGALAEQALLPGAALTPLPDGVGFEEGAAAWVCGLTAWVALACVGQLQRGQTLLVHGARGGVGQACVQLGRHLGAQVLATATVPAQLAGLAAQGVPVLPADNFRDAVLQHTQGRGADLVADPVGGAVFAQSQRCTAWGGRLLVLGFASGQIPTLALNLALIKGHSVVGVRAGEQGRRFPELGRAHRAAVQHLLAQGVLRPTIGARFALADAVAALQALAGRQVTGKVVVRMPVADSLADPPADQPATA